MIYYLLATLLVAVISGVLTGFVRRYAIRSRLLDVPNERSAHSVPTPRGGGVAMVGSTTAGLGVLLLSDQVKLAPTVATIVAALLVAVVGFIDDRNTLSARVRLSAHLSAALILITVGPVLPIFGWKWLDMWPVLAICTTALGLVWLLNLYNFMDGIDGLAAAQAACVAVGLAGVLLMRGAQGGTLWLAFILAGSCIGFLWWNWSPARIFMGDVGSGFLGFMLGALSLDTLRESGVTVHVPLILLAVFVTDATLTLLRRVLRGQKWYQAHSDHAYQRLARGAGGHRRVVLGVLFINVAWLWPMAAASVLWPMVADQFLLIAYIPLVVGALIGGSGKASRSAAT